MRLIDKVEAFWNNDAIDFKRAGCTNPFDNIVVVLAGLAWGFGKLILYIFLIATAIVWLPIYVLCCWITERRYRK